MCVLRKNGVFFYSSHNDKTHNFKLLNMWMKLVHMMFIFRHIWTFYLFCCRFLFFWKGGGGLKESQCLFLIFFLSVFSQKPNCTSFSLLFWWGHFHFPSASQKTPVCYFAFLIKRDNFTRDFWLDFIVLCQKRKHFFWTTGRICQN